MVDVVAIRAWFERDLSGRRMAGLALHARPTTDARSSQPQGIAIVASKASYIVNGLNSKLGCHIREKLTDSRGRPLAHSNATRFILSRAEQRVGSAPGIRRLRAVSLTPASYHQQ